MGVLPKKFAIFWVADQCLESVCYILNIVDQVTSHLSWMWRLHYAVYVASFSRTRCSSQFFPTGIQSPDLWQCGTKVKYVTSQPPSPPSLMFHFLKSSWRSLWLQKRDF